ncbi:response regulator [Sulfurivermis fontis]|uniref:GGDEF domain-containing response regulator n=1 Tax=Sulfurivermis fontis TaxID=1972068 RepID=UPI000FD7DF70|nr:response regulator [Sulfurivermis fontis]
MSDDGQGKAKILAADDSRLIRASFSRYLGEQFELVLCEDGQQAWEVLERTDDFTLLFTDLSMPRLDGYALLERIRASENPAIRELPVIIVTGKEDEEEARERLLALGATDFINKPFHSSELVSRARGYASLRKTVTRLEQQAPIDKLTGLMSRYYFLEQGKKHLALARRQGFKISVARIAVANLEELKREFGVPLVVKMLAVVAKVLRDSIRTEDLAASFSTGQFALLLLGADPQATVQVWARLRSRLATFELKVGERKASILFKAGISTQNVAESADEFDGLVQQAEDSLRAQLMPPS